MKTGIFAKTYKAESVEKVFDRMTSQGIFCTQFNLSCAGIESLPNKIAEEKLKEIRETAAKYKVHMAALSGTFNMIDIDIRKREDGCRRFHEVCRAADYLNIPIVTLCTGSRHPEDKWTWHPDNDSNEAWEDLLATTEIVLKDAEEYDLILGIEIEASNIINSPERARKYMDAFSGNRLKIIMDGANLFLPHQVKEMKKTLQHAFEIVGKDIVLAHGKDLFLDETISFGAAGKGILDFEEYIGLLKKYGYDGAVIMHGLKEEQVPESKKYLEGFF